MLDEIAAVVRKSGVPVPDALRRAIDLRVSLFDDEARTQLADVLLLIEVSDTTLRYDLNTKARLYATHGIREYWVVDLVANKVWRHFKPGTTQFAERAEISRGAIALPKRCGEIDLAELF